MRVALKMVLTAATAALITAGAAAAADLGSAPAPAADMGSVEAFRNFQIKAGVTVIPWDDSNNGVFAGGAQIPGASAHLVDVVVPTATLTYYFDKHWAAELLCCFVHGRVHGDGSIAGLGAVAETWTFPPVLTAQYHFDKIGNIRPYVGVGFEYIHYFDSRSDNAAVGTKVNFRDSWGPAVQAGFDYELGGGWSAGFDAKYVWEDTRVTWTGAGGVVSSVHDVNPLMLTANVGYRFNLGDILPKF